MIEKQYYKYNPKISRNFGNIIAVAISNTLKNSNSTRILHTTNRMDKNIYNRDLSPEHEIAAFQVVHILPDAAFICDSNGMTAAYYEAVARGRDAKQAANWVMT